MEALLTPPVARRHAASPTSASSPYGTRGSRRRLRSLRAASWRRRRHPGGRGGGPPLQPAVEARHGRHEGRRVGERRQHPLAHGGALVVSSRTGACAARASARLCCQRREWLLRVKHSSTLALVCSGLREALQLPAPCMLSALPAAAVRESRARCGCTKAVWPANGPCIVLWRGQSFRGGTKTQMSALVHSKQLSAVDVLCHTLMALFLS